MHGTSLLSDNRFKVVWLVALPSPSPTQPATHAHTALHMASCDGDLHTITEILDKGRQDINAQTSVSHMILCVYVYMYKPLHLPVHKYMESLCWTAN